MIKNSLKHPLLYKLLINLLGGAKSRKIIINDYLRLNPGAKLLDLGCGPAQILSYVNCKVKYTGIDASEDYINAAQKKFPDQQFICTVFDSNTDLKGKFDAVLAIGLIHHLDDETSRNLIINATKVLKDGGKLITFDNVLYKGQRWHKRWIIKQDRGNYIRTLRDYSILFPQNSFSEIQFDLREDLLRVPYSHIISISTK